MSYTSSMMMDLDRVEELYRLQTSPTATPDEQQKARERIAQIADTVVDEYLAALVWGTEGGARNGQPKFDSFGALYCRTLIGANCSGNVLGVPEETDKVGTVLLHRRYVALGH